MIMDNFDIRLIQCATSEYDEELALRDRVLRKPLGLSIYNDDLEKEKNDWHIGCFKDGILAGVLVLTAHGANEVKMRQVAVDERCRGNNIGSGLVNYAERFAEKNGFGRIVLNSRKTAVGFYEKLKYKTVGEEFIEVTIPHYKMQKDLGNDRSRR